MPSLSLLHPSRLNGALWTAVRAANELTAGRGGSVGRGPDSLVHFSATASDQRQDCFLSARAEVKVQAREGEGGCWRQVMLLLQEKQGKILVFLLGGFSLASRTFPLFLSQFLKEITLSCSFISYKLPGDASFKTWKTALISDWHFPLWCFST